MKNTKLSVTALILVLVSILLVSCSPGNSNVSENNDNQTVSYPLLYERYEDSKYTNTDY